MTFRRALKTISGQPGSVRSCNRKRYPKPKISLRADISGRVFVDRILDMFRRRCTGSPYPQGIINSRVAHGLILTERKNSFNPNSSNSERRLCTQVRKYSQAYMRPWITARLRGSFRKPQCGNAPFADLQLELVAMLISLFGRKIEDGYTVSDTVTVARLASVFLTSGRSQRARRTKRRDRRFGPESAPAYQRLGT